jgi:hypothetical protein
VTPGGAAAIDRHFPIAGKTPDSGVATGGHS